MDQKTTYYQSPPVNYGGGHQERTTYYWSQDGRESYKYTPRLPHQKTQLQRNSRYHKNTPSYSSNKQQPSTRHYTNNTQRYPSSSTKENSYTYSSNRSSLSFFENLRRQPQLISTSPSPTHPPTPHSLKPIYNPYHLAEEEELKLLRSFGWTEDSKDAFEGEFDEKELALFQRNLHYLKLQASRIREQRSRQLPNSLDQWKLQRAATPTA